VGDVVMRDNISTLHQAWPDHTEHEHRLKRGRVMADRMFDPEFARQA
jgi:alpha-ketoglutarate-dependent taurine dioxygenase